LHAKVFVFGNQAFVGSTNVSKRSEGTLKEAVMRTTERETVRAAKNYVRGFCLQELGSESLNRLKQLYREPRFPGGKKRRRKQAGRLRAEFSKLRIAKLIIGDPPKGSELAEEQGQKFAESKRKHRRTHFLDKFQWNNNSFRRGESVIQVVEERDGRSLVVPPGEVINTKDWSNGRQSCTFVFLEVPSGRRMRVNKLAKRLGRGASKRLRRSGWLRSDFAERVRRLFQK